MAFSKTQNQLHVMAANESFGRGIHKHDETRPGKRGHERIFDATTKASQVRHQSVRGLVTGVPHVRHGIPRLPMNVNLILDNTTGAQDSLRVQEVKQGLVERLGKSLLMATPAVSDGFRIFYVGDEGDGFMRRNATAIDEADIPEITSRGVSMLASDFRSLDLGTGRLHNTVAIDVKHPAQLEIPAGRGTIRLSGTRTVNTENPADLARVNGLLAERQHELVERLQGSGLVVSTVVLAPGMPGGFNEQIVDANIASSLKTLTVR